jgi:hypothetical protein
MTYIKNSTFAADASGAPIRILREIGQRLDAGKAD